MSAAERARFVERWLRERANAEDAGHMAAYMKLEARGDPVGFVGVKKEARKALNRLLKQRFPPADAADLEAGVAALWALPMREGRYTAIDFGRAFEKKHAAPSALPLYERMAREGGWWDLVDGVATWLVSPLVLRHRDALEPVMARWLDDDDLWIRRAALLRHLKHKDATDEARLFAECLLLAPEKDFFARKAVGWVLREHSKRRPEAVRDFLTRERERLSGLSFREGAKHLRRVGLMS